MQQAGTLWVADLMQVISFHKDSGITNNTQYLPCMSVWGNSVMQSLYCIKLQTTELSFGGATGFAIWLQPKGIDFSYTQLQQPAAQNKQIMYWWGGVGWGVQARFDKQVNIPNLLVHLPKHNVASYIVGNHRSKTCTAQRAVRWPLRRSMACHRSKTCIAGAECRRICAVLPLISALNFTTRKPFTRLGEQSNEKNCFFF